MAWKIVGAMHAASDPTRHNKVQFGPHPVKVWVRDGKRHKMDYKVPTRVTCPEGKTREVTETRAVQYALWLAKRDGTIIPTNTAKAMPVWATVTTKAGKLEHRVSAVCWHTLGNGRPVGAAVARIEIPHWDWEPEMPTEEIIPAAEAFSALLDDGWNILLKAA
jgi:hypothetical protein